MSLTVSIKRGLSVSVRNSGPRGVAGAGVPTGGTTGQIPTKLSDSDFDLGWTSAGSGDMNTATYDPRGIAADAFDLANLTGNIDGGTFA